MHDEKWTFSLQKNLIDVMSASWTLWRKIFVVIVHRGVRKEMDFIRLSHDGVTLDVDIHDQTTQQPINANLRGNTIWRPE